MSSAGKVAVVTGGGAGIGKACVLRFVKEGMRVVFGDMSAEDGEKTYAMAKVLVVTSCSAKGTSRMNQTVRPGHKRLWTRGAILTF